MIDDLLSYIQSTIVRYITRMSVEVEPSPSSTVGQQLATSPLSIKMDSDKVINPPSIVLNVEQFIRDVENRPAIWNRNYHCNKLFMEQTWDELSALHKLPKQTLKTKWKGLRDNFRVEYKRIPRNENRDMIIPPEQHDSKWTHYRSLLFLTEHMRHRQPKVENEPYFYSAQYGTGSNDDYEQTIVEPDLTNGLLHLHDRDDDSPSPPPPPYPMMINGLAGNLSTLQAPECSSNDSALYSNGGYTASGSCSSNGLIPTLKIKRKRHSEDSDDIKPNIDGLIDNDDDYHYLLSLHPYMKQLNASQKLRIRTKIQKLIFKELYKEDLEEGK